MRNRARNGIGLLEVITVIAIIGVLAGIVIGGFGAFIRSQAVGKEAERLAETLRSARAMTLSSENAARYGVHIDAAAFTLFSGSSYSPSAVSNVVYPFGSGVTATAALLGGVSDVIFSRLSGEADAPGTITLRSRDGSRTASVTIAKTGVIQ